MGKLPFIVTEIEFKMELKPEVNSRKVMRLFIYLLI